MTRVRNTPLQSRVARNGFTPLPGQQTVDHPPLFAVPLKTKVEMKGEDRRR